jgi:hypothetical protein
MVDISLPVLLAKIRHALVTTFTNPACVCVCARVRVCVQAGVFVSYPRTPAPVVTTDSQRNKPLPSRILF